MKKAILLVILGVVALAGFGIYKLVTSMSRAGTAGDDAVAAFHREFNARRGDAIHQAAAPAFRNSVSSAEFSALIATLHEKLGEWKSTDRTGINLSNDNGNTTLKLNYKSTFAKGDATEEFVFDYNTDVPLLFNYHIQSPLLIEKPAAKASGEEPKPDAGTTATPGENQPPAEAP